MSQLPDPEDIDVFVGGVEPDPESYAELQRLIDERRSRPDFALKVENAKRALADLGINLPDADALLENWHACASELRRRDAGSPNGNSAEREGRDTPAGTPRSEPT